MERRRGRIVLVPDGNITFSRRLVDPPYAQSEQTGSHCFNHQFNNLILNNHESNLIKFSLPDWVFQQSFHSFATLRLPQKVRTYALRLLKNWLVTTFGLNQTWFDAINNNWWSRATTAADLEAKASAGAGFLERFKKEIGCFIIPCSCKSYFPYKYLALAQIASWLAHDESLVEEEVQRIDQEEV